MKKFINRTSYLIFRLIYVSSHYLIFKINSKKWKAILGTSSDEYIIICGIELNSEDNIKRIKHFREYIKQNFQDKKVIHLSKNISDAIYYTEYDIVSIPWEYETRARLFSNFFKILYRKGSNTKDENEIRKYLINCYSIYDLGKKQISSNLGTGWTANVIANIITSVRFNKPYIMLSQEFGPFNYPHIFNFLFNRMLKNIFPEVARVYPKDETSSKYISRFLPSEKIIQKNYYESEHDYYI